ncbi:MAG: leucine-rich repeat domain-containing protein [Prevotellamassilia sp.]|nr:leucine-rich repeat domain-containing protein [Prevotellamassilia sp.]
MKKFKSLMLAVIGLLCSINASAHDFEVDGIYYNIISYEDRTVEVTHKGAGVSIHLNEYKGEVIIPEYVTFRGTTFRVTRIRDGALYDCSNLTSVVIPNSVASIDHSLLSRTAWYENQPDGLVYLENFLLGYKGTMPANTTIEIKEGTLSIASSAFSGCEGLTSVVIPESVTSIGDRAFDGCSGLTSVEIPNSVTSIGDGAFWGCSGLTSVVIPNSVTSVGRNVFYETAWYENQPEGVVYLEKYLLGYKETLPTTVNIKEGITLIADGAFEYCDELTSVTIPNSVVSIGTSVFYRCSNLTSIIVEESNPVYDSRGDCNAIIESSSKTLIAGCSSSTIPEGVTSIGEYAFYGYSGLTSVVIPNSVTSIGEYAFGSCYSLTSLTLPNKFTSTPNVSIGAFAFISCSGLTNIEIPECVVSIGHLAFSDCDGLTSVEIPYSVKYIGTAAFGGNNIASIEVDSNNIYYDSRANCNAIIEKSTKTLIAGCKNTIIPSSVTAIGATAFGRSNLTSIEIPEGVTSIGDLAFWCNSMDSIVIPKSVTSIEPSVFYVGHVNSLYIEDIASWCKINFGDHWSNPLWYSQEESLYLNGEKVTDLVIPDGVTSIGNYAFYGWNFVTSVVIPKSVTSIGEQAFEYCLGLTTITSLNEIPPTISSSTFSKYEYDATLYVPYGSKTAYSTAEYWKNFTNIVELTPSYDLTVSTAGYATLYLDYATEIPESVEVYTAKEVDGIWLKMTQVEEVLPAHTAVIVKAPAGTYTFMQTATDAPAITNNLLMGTNEDTYIDVPSNSKAFVLSMVDGEVGMYLAKLTDGRFLNNANKAYLLLDNNKLEISDEELDTSVGGAQLSLRFDFGGATGVDKVQTETGINNATYDMYGRKVNNITTPGLYIVNGKKVWVK